AFTTTTLVAALPPRVSVAPATNPVPVIVTGVPPAVGPVAGAMLLTVGAGARYVNWSATFVALVWLATVTRTSTVAAAWAGLVAALGRAACRDTAVPAFAAKATVVAPGDVLNPVPVIVIGVPPAIGPLGGA